MDELLNIIQYAVLAIIPIIILLKLIKNYIPEADDDKGSLVILVEVMKDVDKIQDLHYLQITQLKAHTCEQSVQLRYPLR